MVGGAPCSARGTLSASTLPREAPSMVGGAPCSAGGTLSASTLPREGPSMVGGGSMLGQRDVVGVDTAS